MKTLEEYLQESARMHRHLCPRQVLGVRLGLFAGKLLEIELPQEEKQLLAVVETDGCTVDGISVVTNCTVGHRTLRIEDYGKIAATFIDTETGKSIRIVPRSAIRELAYESASVGSTKWESQLVGYQRMADEQLFSVQEVELNVPIGRIVSRPGRKAVCQQCGEEIINERELRREGAILCRACGGQAYYHVKELVISEEPST